MVAAALGQELGGDQVVLGPADRGVDPLGGDVRAVEVERLHRLLDGAEPIGLVVDREAAVEPDQGGVGPEQPGAETVERPDPDAGVGSEGHDPLAHLAGGLVRERQRQDLLARDPLREQVADAAGDHPRLARPRPRQDQERPFHVRHGLALGGGQVGE